MVKLQLSKASQVKIAKPKARKQLLDDFTYFRDNLADPVLESKLGNVLKHTLDHGSDEGLKTAISKIVSTSSNLARTKWLSSSQDFFTSISPSILSRKRSHKAADLKAMEPGGGSKKARITKERKSDALDRVIAAPHSSPRLKATKNTRSSEGTTAKPVKRKLSGTEDPHPLKKGATAKSSTAKKATKTKSKCPAQSKESIETASRKRLEAASPPAGQDQKARIDDSAVAIADATADVNTAFKADANVFSSGQVDAILPDQAQGHAQAEAEAFGAKDGDTAPSTDRAPSSAQASTQSPDQACV